MVLTTRLSNEHRLWCHSLSWTKSFEVAKVDVIPRKVFIKAEGSNLACLLITSREYAKQNAFRTLNNPVDIKNGGREMS